jgi:hypothetical protein
MGHVAALAASASLLGGAVVAGFYGSGDDSQAAHQPLAPPVYRVRILDCSKPKDRAGNEASCQQLDADLRRANRGQTREP